MGIFIYATLAVAMVIILYCLKNALNLPDRQPAYAYQLRKFTFAALIVTGSITVGAACILAYFVQVSQSFTEVIAGDYITESRIILKTAPETGAAYSIVRLIGEFSLLLFGFISYFSCTYLSFVLYVWRGMNRFSGIRQADEPYGFKPSVYARRKTCFLLSHIRN